ncbi:hypothetical protein CVT43_02530 [Enterococcus faecalis OG1RF]|nr:hypothetical protein CVT43_02530 [Enterococcus faecalis OG1RF]AZV96123.1 hypothetical protein CVT44_02530 [Enterococcus faecalis]EGO9003388.1 hypothetical protein [Enterococcus faecalis]EGO9159859.1 hypothetical protein [Enterococcus faecalis]PIO19046.1 hypothetical protein CE093_04535 [Enterococcus faecalis]
MIVKTCAKGLKFLINKRLSVFERGAKIQSDFCPTLNFFVKAFLAKQISCYFASKSVILDKRQGGLFSGICNNIRRIRRKNYRQSSTSRLFDSKKL